MRRQIGSLIWAAGCALTLILLAPESPGRTPPREASADVGRMQLASTPDWPLFGGTPARNMVAPLAHGLPINWDACAGGRSVKWVVELGNRGYLPPAVAGGRVYVATNNARPRDR